MAISKRTDKKSGKVSFLVQICTLGKGADGKRHMVSRIAKNEKAAMKLEQKLLTERDAGSLSAGRVKVNDLLDAVLLDYKINGKSFAWANILCKNHLRPYFGHLRADRVDTPAIQKYVAHRQAEGAANATVNLDLALLKRAFNVAVQATPPRVARVPHFPMLKLDNVRKGFFEYDQYLAVCDALSDDLKPLLVFAYYTGARRGELLALRWDQIDLSERVCRLNAGETKNDLGRVIPLAPQIVEALALRKAIRDQYWPRCPHVFFQTATGKPVRDFRDGWASACRKAGFWDAATEKPMKLFHDLRRSGVRDLLRSGTPETVAMAISGHRTRSVFDRYNIVSEQDLKLAAARLGDYRETKAQEHVERESKEISTIVHITPTLQ